MDQISWNRHKTAVVCMLLFTSSNAIFFKLSQLQPMVFVSGRFMIASVLFLLLALIRRALSGRTNRPVSRREAAVLMGIGCVYATGAFVYFLALKRTALPSVLLLTCCSAIFIVILSRLFLKEKHGPRAYLATGLAFSGIVVIFLMGDSGGSSLSGNLLALACAMSGATYMVFMKRFAHLDVFLKLFYVYLGSFLFSTVISLAQGNAFFCEGESLGLQQLWILCSGLLSISIPQAVINRSLRHVKASFAGNVALMEPVVASFYGYLIWGEGLTPAHLIGGALILGGLFYYNMSEKGETA